MDPDVSHIPRNIPPLLPFGIKEVILLVCGVVVDHGSQFLKLSIYWSVLEVDGAQTKEQESRKAEAKKLTLSI